MRRVLMGVVMAGVIVGLAAGPASAQTKVRNDSRGDAPSATDIRSVKVQNNAKKMAVTIRIANVTARRTSAVVLTAEKGGDAFYALEAVPTGKNKYRFTVSRAGEDDVAAVRCSTARVTVKRGVNGYFRFVVPQRCLGDDAGTQQTTAITYDKQKAKGQQAGRLLRRGDAPGGDDADAPAGGDTLRSVITTRRA